MGTHFGDAAIFQNNDFIELEVAVDPVGNDDGSFIRQRFVEITKDLLLGIRINGTEAIVKNDDLGMFDEGASNTYALLLSTRERDATLTYHRIKA